MKTVFTFFLFSLFTSILFSQPYVIENFDVEINVTQGGSMEVTETIDVLFNEARRGIFRDIPFRYNFKGKRYKTALYNIDVENYNYQVSSEGPNKRIRIGEENTYISGKHRYTISYTVDKAIMEYQDGQEIYWNLTGNNWDTPIYQVSYRIKLPSPVDISSDFLKVYTGRVQSVASDAVISQNASDEISGQTNNILQAGEGVTIAVKLPLGYLSDLPSGEKLQNAGIDKEKNQPWYLLIPLVLWGIMNQWWRNMRSKLSKKSEITPQYYPPSGLTSAHVGAYIDHHVNDRDVISLIPYWATEGFIKVKGLPDGDMELIRIEDLPFDYPEYERDFFNKIFEYGDSISFSSAKYKFGDTYFKVSRKVVKELEDAGYYDPAYVSIFKSYKWPIACLWVIALAILLMVYSGYLLLGGGLILTAIIGISYSFFTAPLSPFGKEIHEKLKGLEMFLKNPDPEKINELLKEDENYFGRMLPFAVALGLDKQWLQTFDRIYDVAPAWYIMPHYGHRPTFSDFSQNFQVRDITRAFTTFPPSTSSGSSGSSGGFSGGGFGGGGGGSW